MSVKDKNLSKNNKETIIKKFNFLDLFTTIIDETFIKLWKKYLYYDCILDESELKRLGNHKYNATDSSILDHLIFQKFWNWLVNFLPMSLAPNTITLLGLISNLITVGILSVYCYTVTEIAPSWAYFLAALGVFSYQTWDALDGKQARRTNSSSPLGELFDHGCDSMTQVFITLNICYAMQIGNFPSLCFIVNVISVILFYGAQWATYCTGVMKFNKFDVTEAQWSVIIILLISGIFGPEIWNIHFFEIEIKYIVLFFSLSGCTMQFLNYMNSVFNEGNGKNGSTIAGTSILFPVIPLLLVCVPFYFIYTGSTTNVYIDHITLLCLCFGAIGAKATNRLIIAHMSKSELKAFDLIYLAPLAILLNQYYGNYYDEYTILIYATIYAYTNLLIFCVSICKQFCSYLNIQCFSLGKYTDNTLLKVGRKNTSEEKGKQSR
ncbi:Bb in a boxcar [Strongyloides ratti]|uniref:diacylglycerol cholinephosphotransferase n=1 Tax=Strongyloides ratti TaxID=34506 RepID=A0A090LNK2_STRRB|nr:Bb in a boxcar [Strongyloides ratti]CEF71450.1 Bb in a boxcar [Strongyloides ratti]